MRLFIVSIASVFICFISFYIVKFWGQSQVYTEYKHPVLSIQESPVTFVRPSIESLEQDLDNEKNLFLDVVSTLDQKLVLAKTKNNTKPIQATNLADLGDQVVDLEKYKEILKTKNIIFNINENRQAGHEIFLYNLQRLGLEKGENIIVTSPYEAVIREIKDKSPALVFASTKPEILKILAMQSMGLVEAASIRADIIVHPLKIKNQDFFNKDLVLEFSKRYKKIVVGPIEPADKEQALMIKPYGVIINR